MDHLGDFGVLWCERCDLSGQVAADIAELTSAEKIQASGEARCALASAAESLRSYAEAHRALQAPFGSDKVNLPEYLQKLCSTITAARLRGRGVRLTLAADAVALPVMRCWLVALIVSELITNSARHGLQNGPGNIRVEVLARDQAATCRVMDDGPSAPGAMPGRGTAATLGLAQNLGGGIAWHFEASGTTAELVFPIQAEETLS